MPLVKIFLKIKFGYKWKKAKGLKENYIVLSNHVTDFDPLFVGASFRKQMYFVASEHITKWRTAYRWLKFVFDPIIRYKGTIASSTVIDILRKVRNGANVCIFAEGIRSWNGVTSPILPSTAKLVKSAGCSLVTYKITGGYFVSPNWSVKGTRRGKIQGSVVNVYTAEQLSNMTDDEVMDIINHDLYEDAYARQQDFPHKYIGKRLAEKLENFIFKCPNCGMSDSLVSSGDTIGCSKCGHTFRYNQYGYLEGIKHKTILELSNWQKSEIDKDALNNVIYTTPHAKLYEVYPNHERQLLGEGVITMTTNTLEIMNNQFNISDIRDISIFGKHGLVFEYNKKYYEIDIDKEFNAYKYVLYFNAIKKIN